MEQEETDEDPIVDQKERKNCAELLLVFVAAVEAELVVEEDVAGATATAAGDARGRLCQKSWNALQNNK